MIKAWSQTDSSNAGLLAHGQQRLEGMRAYRVSWWVHWAQLAEMFLPRRYRWFVTPNQANRGSPLNASIVDETGMLAARTCATGLLSGLTSPTKPWFKLGLHGIKSIPEGDVKDWLAECTLRMQAVYANSNLYQSLGTAYHDLVVFGSAAMIQYEDKEDVVRFYNPALGEFFFGLSNRNDVDTLYREYTYTVSQAVKEFGLEKLSIGSQRLAKTPGGLDTEIIICHAIEPNTTIYRSGIETQVPLAKIFEYREYYWEQGSSPEYKALLRVIGFREKPHVGLRWDVTSNDAYGRSPGMDALPAVRQLQIEQRRKAEAIDKMVRPPMVASISMKNEPTDILPGGVTYVTDLNSGFKPAFQVEPRIAELTEDIKEVQSRVNSIFFADLFLMISQLDTVRTATEIDARREEKLIQLGPVIERTENEGLDEIIERTFSILSRRGFLPPAPDSIKGITISIEYISMLAEAQRAASTSIIERLVQFVGSIVGVQPDVLDNIDTDMTVETYADRLGVPPDLIRPLKEILQLRAQRAQAQQAQASLATGQAAAAGAQTLSKTDVGGGQNALQAMLGKAA